MKCTIDSLIEQCLGRTHKLEVIRRYIRMKYQINIDEEAMHERAKHIHYAVS